MQKAILVAGLGFGDEGKGKTVDFLVRKHKAKAVVRYNGGAQAAHNVVTDQGLHHTFAQFGSGSFVPGVKTFLSEFVVCNPLSLLPEAEHLDSLGVENIWERLYIDEKALVATPFHQAANRIRESMRGKNRHGSCGMGIGEALEDCCKGNVCIRVKDLLTPDLLEQKLRVIRDLKVKTLDLKKVEVESRILTSDEVFTKILDLYNIVAHKLNIVDSGFVEPLLRDGVAVFEGAQGIMLDKRYGYTPHVTKTDISFSNAYDLLSQAKFGGEINRVGVLRAYTTRHGAGPLPTEDFAIKGFVPEPHNLQNAWQGEFRVGYFDAVLAKYAIKSIGGVDELSLTCLDKIKELPELKVRIGGLDDSPNYIKFKGVDEFIDFIREYASVQIKYLSFGPRASDNL